MHQKLIVAFIAFLFFPIPLNDDITISIDCSKIKGKTKFFSGINCGPLPTDKNGSDLSRQFNEIAINFVRTHDFYGPTDISNIFPDWDASVESKESYNFKESDEVINAIINSGCKVFYRLGESASINDSLRQPPEDFGKWAEICKHIVMHYNDGWNNGYHYNITYWEIWNEPDLSGFWNGSAEEYYRLYEITARTLKEYNQSLKIGGPCVSNILNEEFTVKFIEYVVENKVPLDFFSWHMYSNSPYEIYKASLYIRQLLDKYGLTNCENILTEWNIGILTPQREKDNAKNAAFTACCLIAFQDAGLDYAFRYRATQEKGWLQKLLGLDLSLFTYDGKYKRPALAYLAMKYMQETPVRIDLPPYNLSNGIAYIAGISEDKTNISFLISNYGKSRRCNIEFKNLPWKNFTVVHYLIDEKHHFQIVEKRRYNSSCTMSFNLEEYSVHFIRLTNSTVLPKEGPDVAKIPFILRLHILDPFVKLLAILLLSLVFS